LDRHLNETIAAVYADTTGTIFPTHVRSVDVAARFPQFIKRASEDVLTEVGDYVQLIIGAGDSDLKEPAVHVASRCALPLVV
jgi:hypothetical protein